MFLKFKMKCPGKDKFNNPCNVYLRPNEKYCWKHTITINNDNEQQSKKFQLDTKRLEKLANDEQNIHTPEIQIPLMNVLYRIKSWGSGMKIRQDVDLPTLILSMLEEDEFTITTELALEHLRNIFDSNDNTMMCDITYIHLSILVWARINYCFMDDKEKLKLLRTRFFQEVFESIGQCFNGNMARLINVFSGIDDEMSIQLSSITKEQFVELLLDKIDLLTPEMALQRTYQLLNKAQLPEDEWGYWIDAVRERKGIPLVPIWEQPEYYKEKSIDNGK